MRSIARALACLALFFQLAMGAVVIDERVMQDRMALGLCHFDPSGKPAPPHHLPDCPLCPHVAAVHGLAPLLPTPAALPPPTLRARRFAWTGAAARAPPPAPPTAYAARAPPTLS